MVINTAIWQWEPTRRIEYHMPDAVAFQVVDTLEGDSARGFYPGDLPGTVRPKLEWSTERVGEPGLEVQMAPIAVGESG
jgi:lipopolysaccharide transport system ATP-binding protein